MIVLLALVGASPLAGAAIVIDPARTMQTFDGWGTSLCWWAHVAGGYPPDVQNRIVAQVFGPVRGLGFNVVRYNIGGGENPDHHFLQPRAAIPGFEPAPGRWDWSADRNQRAILAAAIRLGADQLEAFSNSPPWWMCVSGSVTGGKGGAENLRPDQYANFAAYLATVVRHFHDEWHVTFGDVDPLNEPTSRWWTLGNWQEGCRFDPPAQSRILGLLDADLRSAGLPTRVAASDENTTNEALASLDRLTPAARSLLLRVNTHTYGGNRGPDIARRAAAMGKPVWVSEYGDDDASGLKMADQIIRDLKELHATAWVVWQVADPTGGWGLFHSRLADDRGDDWKANKKYFVMAHFSRFIRPRSTLLDVSDPHVIAAVGPGGVGLTVVIANAAGTGRDVDLDLSAVRSRPRRFKLYTTDAQLELRQGDDIVVNGTTARVTVPPRSVVTVTSGSAER
jgi:O-glycosyl hydrolase